MSISLHTRYVVLGFESQQDKHGNGKHYTIKALTWTLDFSFKEVNVS